MKTKKSKKNAEKILKDFLINSSKNALEMIEKAWDEEILIIVKNKEKERYLYAIFLCFSIIEDCLRLAVWTKSAEKIAPIGKKEDVVPLRKYLRYIEKYADFFKKRDFYELIRWALILKIINSKLYEDLDKIRKERNLIIHKLWMEFRRGNYRYLRRKLEFYGRICYEMIDCLEKVTIIREAYDFSVIKNLLFK